MKYFDELIEEKDSQTIEIAESMYYELHPRIIRGNQNSLLKTCSANYGYNQKWKQRLLVEN